MRRLLIVLALVATQAANAQQPRFLTPVAGKGQMLTGAAAANEGSFGLAVAKSAETGFRVAEVSPRGPAWSAGIRAGDVVVSLNGESVADMTKEDFLSKVLLVKPNDKLSIGCLRNGQAIESTVVAEPRLRVWPDEVKQPSGISELVFSGDGAVVAQMLQSPAQAPSVQLNLTVPNMGNSTFSFDDSKVFVLDGRGQQLRRMSLDELKYSIQLWLTQNWRGGNYPPPNPPPPQLRYKIEGTETGNYTLSELGSISTLSGSSSGTYTVQQEPDYSQAGYMLGYSLGRALRQRADRKHNEEVLKQAQQSITQWDTIYFRSQSPVIPGENRSGVILYWTGSQRAAEGPFKVVIFLTNPKTNQEETVTFEFR